jgi:peptidoglycan/LPS O-acetylase OafA/YrhL
MDTRSPAVRVESFDLIRGLCAVMVAAYHMLSWLDVWHPYAWGLHGVYLFFVLSGASMAVAYSKRLGSAAMLRVYLVQRYVRLLPLFAAVCAYLGVTGAFAHSLPAGFGSQLFLNLTFLFGLADPGHTSLVTGGWSLGIEFVFYLTFPVLLAALQSSARWLVVAFCFVVQIVFCHSVLGESLEQSWARYIQFPSFLFYFAAGVVIGLRRLERASLTPESWAWPVLGVSFALVLAGSGASATQTLTGFRGAALTVLCALIVWSASWVRLSSVGSRLAGLLGDASYPLYLLHPIFFGQLSRRGPLVALAAERPVAFVGVMLLVSVAAATSVHRLFERPLLRWAKERLKSQAV